MTETLPIQFTGKGEVKGFEFTRKVTTEKSYLYEVKTEGSTHYEVFVRRASPKCVDFTLRIYSEAEFTETYPKANAFGVWAWTFSSLEKATERLIELTNKP